MRDGSRRGHVETPCPGQGSARERGRVRSSLAALPPRATATTSIAKGRSMMHTTPAGTRGQSTLHSGGRCSLMSSQSRGAARGQMREHMCVCVCAVLLCVCVVVVCVAQKNQIAAHCSQWLSSNACNWGVGGGLTVLVNAHVDEILDALLLDHVVELLPARHAFPRQVGSDQIVRPAFDRQRPATRTASFEQRKTAAPKERSVAEEERHCVRTRSAASKG